MYCRSLLTGKKLLEEQKMFETFRGFENCIKSVPNRRPKSRKLQEIVLRCAKGNFFGNNKTSK